MKLRDRIKALGELGGAIRSSSDWLNPFIEQAYRENQWFTPENSKKAISSIADQFLEEEVLETWAEKYAIPAITEAKKIGLVLAGNIPLVGFHDILSTFVSGNTALIKVSSKDTVLTRGIIDKLIEMHPQAGSYFKFVDQLKGFDAVIATGSNNSARYFEQYFGKYPNIIRKNRNAVAVLDGSETEEDFLALGEDIFNYFGLGCRNVSKVYVPQNYNFDGLLEALHEGYKSVIHHNKYKNNFDYNNALFLLNKVDFLMSGSLILTESKDITSRIATLHYEYYDTRQSLTQHLNVVKNQIQCVVSNEKIDGLSTFSFGKAQQPSISDYADGVDTLEFLKGL